MALANAETLTQPSDLGRYAEQGGGENFQLPGTTSFLSNAQTAALAILLIGAVMAILSERSQLLPFISVFN